LLDFLLTVPSPQALTCSSQHITLISERKYIKKGYDRKENNRMNNGLRSSVGRKRITVSLQCTRL